MDDKMRALMKARIESEAMCAGPIKNKDLVCKDCEFVFDDTERFGNVSICLMYEAKPSNVLTGGKCDRYEKEYKQNNRK